MIVEILISLIITLGLYFWYLSKKINTIKTVGICNKVIDVLTDAKEYLNMK